MKISNLPSNNKSYKFIPNRPSCLAFKNDSETGRRDKNKLHSSKDRRYMGTTNKNTSILFTKSK